MDDLPTQHLDKPPTTPRQPAAGQNWLKLLGIVMVACTVSTLVAVTAVYFYLFPGPFKPVTLGAGEEQVLEHKLERFDAIQRSPTLHKIRRQPGQDEPLQPERYSETHASREIVLSERELNALLARNTDLATKLAIDLSRDLASAKLRIPIDENFPVFGGKTLKLSAGLEMSYRGERPVIVFRGISLWGVPVPNAWLGNIKHVDLVQEFERDRGFWQAFADGIEEIEITDGYLRVKLKE